jgi:O-antigen/teichoic acid export membrane protein
MPVAETPVRRHHPPSLEARAVRSGAWFAALNTCSQVLSWAFTVYIAKLLTPGDYGLMTMGAFLTAYMEVFAEMGLGTAIVHRLETTQEELSSVFWLAVSVGVMLSLVCLGLAYPTAWIFNDRRTLPVTCLIAPLFVVGSAMTVPLNILRRNLEFRKIGVANIVSALVANIAMVFMGLAHFGVFALISGVIVMRATKVALMFYLSRWKPAFHFSFRETRPFLAFGVNIAGSSSLVRVFESLDKFVVGRFFGATFLGYYGFALSLASMPVEKVYPIVQQVLFPLLSRYQHNETRCADLFLKSMRYYGLLVVPVLVAGVVFPREAILGLLGSKWEPTIPFFRVFCLAKLFESMSEFTNLLHLARGRSNRLLWFSVVKVSLMPSALLVAAHYGPSALTIPWLYGYTSLCAAWIAYGIRVNGVPIRQFMRSFASPLVGAFGIALATLAVRFALDVLGIHTGRPSEDLVEVVVIGATVCVAFVLTFERRSVSQLWRLLLQTAT